MVDGPTPLRTLDGLLGGEALVPSGLLTDAIGALGRGTFEARLTRFLNEICHADHFHIFKFEEDVPTFSASISLDGTSAADFHSRSYCEGKLWRFDQPFAEAGRSFHDVPVLFRWRTETARRELKEVFSVWNVNDRITIFGPDAHGTLGFTAIRSKQADCFNDDEMHRLGMAAEMVLPLLVRHQSLKADIKKRLTVAMASLGEIERSLSLAPEALTPREIQVGSRTLHGLSAEAIALDLEVGYQTVITHRKRLYDRLTISCSRELWRWYLNLHGEIGHWLLDS